MMEEQYRIYVDQLRNGDVERLSEVFPPDFLDVNESDLAFHSPVKLEGEAYLADDELVLHYDASTECQIPCRVCNEPVQVAIDIKGAYQAIPLKEIKGAVFDYRELLREALLLEVPNLVECRNGKCPQRKTLAKYFKKETAQKEQGDEEGYQPFANLDVDLGIKKSVKKKKVEE